MYQDERHNDWERHPKHAKLIGDITPKSLRGKDVDPR
jgi:hypothetical protein